MYEIPDDQFEQWAQEHDLMYLWECPVCGYGYSHFDGFEEIDGEDDYKAWEGRGNCYIMKFWGECGHKWNISIGFHKGENFVKVESDCKEYQEPDEELQQIKDIIKNDSKKAENMDKFNGVLAQMVIAQMYQLDVLTIHVDRLTSIMTSAWEACNFETGKMNEQMANEIIRNRLLKG